MPGMNRHTGKPLNNESHLAQSIGDIVSTRLKSRTMLMDYGSNNLDLVDSPMGELFDVEIQSSVGVALDAWEPRFELTRVSIVSKSSDGRAKIDIDGVVKASGRVVRLEGITI